MTNLFHHSVQTGGGVNFSDQVGVAMNGIDQSRQFTLNYYQEGGGGVQTPQPPLNPPMHFVLDHISAG